MNKEQIENEYQKYSNLFKDFQEEVFKICLDFKKENGNKLDIAEVKQRSQIKTLDSLLGNFTKHNKYADFQDIFEIKDIAGIRVVCHCEDDLENATLLLEGKLREFYNNVNVEQKGGDQNHGKSRPSYRAVHITFSKTVPIEKIAKELFCEIQMRTVMSDAWAIQDREYIYGMQAEGDAYDLTDAVAVIMNGCEGLWSLVKKKSKNSDQSFKSSVMNFSQQIANNLSPVSGGQSVSSAMNKWYEDHEEKALVGLKAAEKDAFYKVKSFLPYSSLSVGKKTILDVASKSTIRTFGWPIALVMTKEEYRPKPDTNGVFAEISTPDRYFDYWSIHQNLSFFLLKSIFEDERNKEEIFFNTRIVRIAETLMYLRNLYQGLGVSDGEKILIEITHSGLSGRTLGSSNPARSLHWSRSCSVNSVTTPVTTSINEIDSSLSDVVVKFTKPLFEQFDFFELNFDVLKDIVDNFKDGKVV